jgi:hypothetical protein
MHNTVNVTYDPVGRIGGAAEFIPIRGNTVRAAVAATAHWFDRAAFYREELEAAHGFGAVEDLALPRDLDISLDAFVGLALPSSHAAGAVERFGSDGARTALRDLAAPYRVDNDHVRFGYLFHCITVRREP